MTERLKQNSLAHQIGLAIGLAALCAGAGAPASAQTDPCFSRNPEMSDDERIAACTIVLEQQWVDEDEATLAHTLRGIPYKNIGSLFAALDDFDLALVGYPADEMEAELFKQRGHSYALLHVFIRARHDFESAVSFFPSDERAAELLSTAIEMEDMLRLRPDIPVKGKVFTLVGTPTGQTSGLVQWYIVFF
jgi:lipoprotein NlpI